MKKSILFSALLGSALFLGACSSDEPKEKPEDESAAEETQEKATDELEDQGAVDKSDTAKSDDALKEEFAKEEGVENVGLIVTEDAGGYVLLDFDVSADTEEEQAQKIADQFAEKIKKEYKDYKVDVQARKNGETFAKKTIE